MQSNSPSISRGAIAGLLGALTLAVWFLIWDVIRGDPFYTPAFVASSLAGIGEVRETIPLLALYTVLHFALFTALGIFVAWLLDRTNTAPHLLLGLVLGFLLFDVVFYAGVVLTGVDVVRTLGWPAVLIGNLLAGLALMGYLAAKAGVSLSVRAVLAEHQTLREGLMAGLIGAFAVAAWFLIIDVARGQLLFTPAALGSALFAGARGVSEVEIRAATVIGYTILHFTAFIAAGSLASALASAAEREPPVLLGAGLLFFVLETLFLGLLAIMASWLLDALNWWSVVAANVIAAITMGLYLWHEHPLLREELNHDIEEELVRIDVE